MYNTNMVCTYMTIQDEQLSNETYQNELLAVFGLTTYSDRLLTFIQQLYTDYPMKEIVKHIPFQYSEDPELLFLVLFSYDYFNYTHNLLCKIMTKQDSMQCQTELITILNNN